MTATGEKVMMKSNSVTCPSEMGVLPTPRLPTGLSRRNSLA
jgi:hypothetical protein